jgi:hypothetical protein
MNNKSSAPVMNYQELMNLWGAKICGFSFEAREYPEEHKLISVWVRKDDWDAPVEIKISP